MGLTDEVLRPPGPRRLSRDDAEHRVAPVGPGFPQLGSHRTQMRVDDADDAPLRRLADLGQLGIVPELTGSLAAPLLAASQSQEMPLP